MSTYLIAFPGECQAGCSMQLYRVPEAVIGENSKLLLKPIHGFYVVDKPLSSRHPPGISFIRGGNYVFWQSGQNPEDEGAHLQLIHDIVIGNKYGDYRIKYDEIIDLKRSDEKLVTFFVKWEVDF